LYNFTSLSWFCCIPSNKRRASTRYWFMPIFAVILKQRERCCKMVKRSMLILKYRRLGLWPRQKLEVISQPESAKQVPKVHSELSHTSHAVIGGYLAPIKGDVSVIASQSWPSNAAWRLLSTAACPRSCISVSYTLNPSSGEISPEWILLSWSSKSAASRMP
jgi:hypothetical protein